MPKIAIVIDQDFEPWGEPEIVAEEKVKIYQTGEWTPYGVIVFNDCPEGHGRSCPHSEELDSLWGCVVETGQHENVYDTPASITDDHLRQVAVDMLPNALTLHAE